MSPEWNACLARNTSAVLTIPLAHIAIDQTTSTHIRAREWRTTANPSARSCHWPRPIERSLWSRRAGDERDEEGREREGRCIDHIDQVRAGGRHEQGAEHGPERGRRPVDELEQGVRGAELARRHEVRNPGEDGGAEERVADSRHDGQQDDRAGRVRERERCEHARAGRGRRRSSAACGRAGRRAARAGGR